MYQSVCRPEACLIDHMGCASQSQLMYDHILTLYSIVLVDEYWYRLLREYKRRDIISNEVVR